MSYKLTASGNIQRLSDGASLPARWENGALVELDPDSPFVKELREWIALGNTPESANPPPPPSKDELDAAAALQYQKLLTLRSMSPAQVQAWVAANVTNLAQAQDAIMTLAIAVSVLARRI